jgi:C-terminal processing protease CtpA/Prc
MNKRTKLAIAVALSMGILVSVMPLLFHSQKPVRHRQSPPPAEVVGIGVALRINLRTHELLVMDVISNTPAADAGITNGLIISKVDDTTMQGMALTNCANLIRGPVGSTVRLELVTPNHIQTNVMELTRRQFKF